jgi:hypothetical protein
MALRSLRAIKGPPYVHGPVTQVHFEHTTTPNLCDHAVDLLERFECVIEL